MGWQTPGWLYYAGESVDRFVFVRDGNGGRVIEVRVPSLRLNLTVHDSGWKAYWGDSKSRRLSDHRYCFY